MQVHLAPYGADFTINFELYEPTGVDLIGTAVHASGDVTVYEDEATAVTADNGFTDEGAIYSLVCSAAELTGKRATYAIVDQTGTKVWLDKTITVETYGHPLSMHPHLGVPSYELAGAGAPQAASATTVTLPTGADNTDNDSYNAVVMIESGLPPMVSYGSYVASTRVFTFDPAPGLTYTTAAWVGPMKLPSAPANSGVRADIATAQADLDIITGSDGVTLATSQVNYAPATASALATVDANVDTLLTRITSSLFTGITSLAEWLGLIAGKQVGDTTARTELRATGAGSGTFDETTDSAEALRDRGDSAWTTGGGGSAPTAGEVADAVWDEVASGHVTAGTFGKSVADILVDTSTDLADAIGGVGTTTDTLASRLSATRAGYLDELGPTNIPADLDAVLADTNELQGDDVPGLIAALNDISTGDVNTQAAAAITSAFGIVTGTVNDASATTTGFTVTTDVSTDIRLGVLRFTDGDLADESRLVTHTGTTIAVVQPSSVPAGLTTVGPFSAAVANGVAYTFRPL